VRRWKHDYLLRTNQMSDLKSDRGFTIVELLASIAILSIVILLAGSVHMFGQRQFTSQTESASQANDMSYALSVMSRDLRKESAASVTVNEDKNEITVQNGSTFTHQGQELNKNGTEVLSKNVKDATFELLTEDGNNKGITVTLYSSNNQQSQSKKYQTTIYFRR